MTQITGLDAYGLESKRLAGHGNRTCRVAVHLETYHVTPAVVKRHPEGRHAYLARRVEKWIAAIRRLLPHVQFSLELRGALPHSVVGHVAIADVQRLARCRGVRSVHVSRIRGLRRARMNRSALPLFCVRGRVVIQVEGQARGTQSVEDRFVLIRASSDDDARHRLRRHWREYAAPYINHTGHLVRWQLEEVVDVYTLTDDHILDGPVEVYSSLSERRMKPGDVWNPRATEAGGRTGSVRRVSKQ